MRFICILFAISASLLTNEARSETTLTPNLALNGDIARQYQNALKGEQVIMLTNSQEQFYALQLEQLTATPHGGLLLLHDKGHNLAWPHLLQQVRQYMPEVGWNTVSIDLPTPAHNAPGFITADGTASSNTAETFEQWQARILERVASGVKQLNDSNIFNIVIIGYGDGAYWGARYLSERLAPEEVGYGLILVDPSLDHPEIADFIASMDIPILDLYMNDSDFAHHQAKLRKGSASRSNLSDYLQIHDALRQNAYGKPSIDRSTRRVWGWLKTHAAGQEAQLTEATMY